MRITVATSIPRLGYDLAADLEARGFNDVTVSAQDVEAFALHHSRNVSPGEIARLLDAIKPLQPDKIHRDDDMEPDQVHLYLGDESPLNSWEVRIHTDSPSL